MSTSIRAANLTVAIVFLTTAAATIAQANHTATSVGVFLWFVAILQIFVALGPLGKAVQGDKA